MNYQHDSYRFRYDGIVDDTDGDNSIVPITVHRKESEKFKLQWPLLPGESTDFPEDSLTQEEKVSFSHFLWFKFHYRFSNTPQFSFFKNRLRW